MKLIDRTNEEIINNQGCKMKIIKYKNADDIDIEFEDGTIINNVKYVNFKNKGIKNHNYPSVYNIGYVGYGNYKTKIDNIMTKKYKTWQSMLMRCYDKRYQEKQPTYKDCTVNKEWHNFQNFAKWYEENLWSEECTCLDKDILIKGNKIYSSNNCILVNKRINNLFLKSNKIRGEYPIGVNYHKYEKKFASRCNIDKGKRISLGYFNTSEEAFEVYKSFKESYIKQVADEYKTKYPNFPQKLYDAMYRYEVEIND